jgi:hypothetical protein
MAGGLDPEEGNPPAVARSQTSRPTQPTARCHVTSFVIEALQRLVVEQEAAEAKREK